jgi:hypothetical protein
MKSLQILIVFFLGLGSLITSQAQTINPKTDSIVASIDHEDGIITLTWMAESVVNASYFVVEKSYDGVHFFITGSKIAYTRNAMQKNYEVTDILDSNAHVYYKITLVNMEGRHLVSNILTHTVPTIQNQEQPIELPKGVAKK